MKMNYKESAFTKEHFIDTPSRLEKNIKSCNYDKRNNSIGKQLDLFYDFNDIILEINSNRILFPDFSMQLKISPRVGWNEIF
jgi:hypothetical protein